MIEWLRSQEARRFLRIPLLLAALTVVLALSRSWPTDQAVRVVLGAPSERVLELRIRYADAADAHEDWLREATFHYAKGHAPRIVSHEPRLASGDYDVEIEVRMAGEAATSRTMTAKRRVTLSGGSTAIDVSEKLDEDAKGP